MEDKVNDKETILNTLRNMFGKSKTFDLNFPTLRVERIDGSEKHVWEYEIKFELVEEMLCRVDEE